MYKSKNRKNVLQNKKSDSTKIVARVLNLTPGKETKKLNKLYK
jgi:hypothetical protein